MRPTIFLPIIVVMLLLSACSAPLADQTDSDSVSSPAFSDESPQGDPATAAQAARQHLAARLRIDAGDIAVEDAEPREWSDSCLGLGGPAESCAAVITPGFAFLLLHDGAEYHYRTNADGTAVRAE